jgi:hypothetical protein
MQVVWRRDPQGEQRRWQGGQGQKGPRRSRFPRRSSLFYTPTPLHPYTPTPLHPYTPTPLAGESWIGQGPPRCAASSLPPSLPSPPGLLCLWRFGLGASSPCLPASCLQPPALEGV